MKLKKLFPMMLFPFLLSGCLFFNKKEDKNNEPSTQDPSEPGTQKDTDTKIKAKVPAMIGSSSGYEVTFLYNDDFFKESASIDNNKLLMLSFASAASASKLDWAQKFYSDIGFDNFYATSEYTTGSSENSIVFVMAHKRIDDFDLISISFRGNNYSFEWANNLEVGDEGNHVGFEKCTGFLVDFLKNHLKSFTNYKLWLTGYSRGGCIANALSSKLMESDEFSFNKDNLYTYTYEASQTLTQDHAIAYVNVRNVLIGGDIIPKIAPKEYGLYRCGIDIDIYNSEVGLLLKTFSNDLYLETFQPNAEFYSNDTEFADYLMSQILKKDVVNYPYNQYPYDLNTREHYFVVQNSIRYFVNLFNLDYRIMDAVGAKASSMGMADLYALTSDDGTKLHDLLKPILDQYNVSYDDADLRSACSYLAPLAKRYLSLVIMLYQSNNSKRMIKLHMTEAVYVLLDHYVNSTYIE